MISDAEVLVTRLRPARWAAATALAVAAVLVSSTPVSAEPEPRSYTEPPFARYVALGDSYSAGPLIPVQTGEPTGCLRSTGNFPSLVAKTLGVAGFTDVSCSGATTDDFTAPQPVPLGANPPQFDALEADADLVTLTIGGNDIGFASIIQECATRSPREPLGAACRDFYTAGGTDELAARIEATAPKVAAALAEITERAPHARTLLVGYPALLPDSGPGCFPVVPFSAGDVAYLRATEKRLNAMLAAQARKAGVDYVDTYTPTIGHDMCAPPGTKWIEGLVPTAPAAPAHPNALGMASMAASVVGTLSDATVLTPAS
ncbi:SGNH/GDSL hydrolase family protein [Pseudonocardia acidicola]|uniref:SGNH/GDSL hydrolase family protein n=1 Tax=Pseudonocardia acidicola TaxID=2724939 RepID=A0ABX1SGK9_9PSEU|nr:SGNH/GDSL hydrolase family protein [Pseudonocardia acidicola]NMH99394.1 SGNH/GDSL hydrolase family protein [Pseudonocardia acidicola]